MRNDSYIEEEVGRMKTENTLLTKMLKNRIIILNGEVNDFSAMEVITKLLYLDQLDIADIKLYINSPGGLVTAGLAIYDTMKLIESKVHTICIGQAASMGAFLLASGDKRSIAPNAKVMIHQPLGGTMGQASDIEIHSKEILKTKKQLNKLLAKATGKPLKRIEKDSDRDFFMNAKQSKKYGIIDNILKVSKK